MRIPKLARKIVSPFKTKFKNDDAARYARASCCSGKHRIDEDPTPLLTWRVIARSRQSYLDVPIYKMQKWNASCWLHGQQNYQFSSSEIKTKWICIRKTSLDIFSTTHLIDNLEIESNKNFKEWHDNWFGFSSVRIFLENLLLGH